MRGRVVVAGGAGFLGSHLCERLIAENYEVLCLDNLLTGREDNLHGLRGDPFFHFEPHEVCTPITVPGRVDAVLHFASPASPVDYARFPLETLKAGSLGTLNLLELARHKNARFVVASTSEVYGDPDVHPQPETYWGNVNPVGPRACYDEAKRFSEAATAVYRSQGVDTGIIRIFNTFGPRMRADDGRAVPTFIRQALAGEPLTVAGDGSQTRSLCFVGDLVDGVLAMMRATDPGPVNLGDPTELSILQLALRIAELLDCAAGITFVPLPTDDPRVRRPDISRARARLGWQPHTPLDQALRVTIDACRAAWAHGPLRGAHTHA